MAPGRQDLAIYQGDDFTLDAYFSVDGVPLPLDGYTFRAQIRTVSADADDGIPPLAEFTCTVVDAAAGHLLLELPSEQSETLTVTHAHWDLEGEVGGSRSTFLAGKVKITAEVTREVLT